MQSEFWHDRWQRGQIGFHLPEVHWCLRSHWSGLGVAGTGRVFVPLCGKSVDLLWLRDRAQGVVGVELSAIAVQAFCAENGIPARRRPGASFDLYEAPKLELLCGDFFALAPDPLANITAVYDRAALISWTAGLRESYALHMAELTPSGVQTLLVTMEFPQRQKAGPPFSIPSAEVDRLYSDRYAIEELARHDILATEPRMRAAGVTELFEVCYRLTRL